MPTPAINRPETPRRSACTAIAIANRQRHGVPPDVDALWGTRSAKSALNPARRRQGGRSRAGSVARNQKGIGQLAPQSYGGRPTYHAAYSTTGIAATQIRRANWPVPTQIHAARAGREGDPDLEREHREDEEGAGDRSRRRSREVQRDIGGKAERRRLREHRDAAE